MDKAELLKYSNTSDVLNKVDLVILDDDKNLVETILLFVVTDDKVVDTYHTAQDFLNNFAQYAKDTNFLLDNQYKDENITGVQIAQQLHEAGFTNLYLFSAECFSETGVTIPEYLTVIPKDDIAAVKRFIP